MKNATGEWVSSNIEPRHRKEGSGDSPNLLINILIEDGGEPWSDQVVGYYVFHAGEFRSQETDEPVEAAYMGDAVVTHYAYINEPA